PFVDECADQLHYLGIAFIGEALGERLEAQLLLLDLCLDDLYAVDGGVDAYLALHLLAHALLHVGLELRQEIAAGGRHQAVPTWRMPPRSAPASMLRQSTSCPTGSARLLGMASQSRISRRSWPVAASSSKGVRP